MEITDAKIEELKAAHPGVTLEKLIHSTLDTVIARPPNEGEWKLFNVQRADDQLKVNAYKQIVLSCVVFPGRDEVKKMIADHPGLADTWANQLAEMSGVDRGMRREKL